MGTKFALVTGGNAVVQLDDKFNVKFRMNRSRSWLALADQELTFGKARRKALRLV